MYRQRSGSVLVWTGGDVACWFLLLFALLNAVLGQTIDLSKSTVTGSGYSVQADGVSVTTIVVTLLDSTYGGVDGILVSLASNRAERDNVSLPMLTNVNGTATFTVSTRTQGQTALFANASGSILGPAVATFTPVSTSTAPSFSTVCLKPPCPTALSTTQIWQPRSNAFTFSWNGAIWIAGGQSITTSAPGSLVGLSDVWATFDQGRTWIVETSLPGPCTTSTSGAVPYNGGMFLICAGFYTSAGVSSHGPSGQKSYFSPSFSIPQVWQELGANGNDGMDHRVGFTVNQMAVPFDGIGTLFLLGGLQTNGQPMVTNDVWWLSATRSFQNTSNPSTWTQFTATSTGASVAAYTSPWSPRMGHSTTTDVEGLTLIMLGGLNDRTLTMFDDVWQMTWASGAMNPFWFQITASAPYPARKFASLYTVQNSLLLYGGSQILGLQDNGFNLDDVWSSIDGGYSWTLASSVGTGTPRHGVIPVVSGRRSYILGGSTLNDGSMDTSSGYINDVWQAFL